jgi:hypothetical protein
MEYSEIELGKVVTVKFTNGIELIARVVGVSDNTSTIYLNKPRVVVVKENELALVPYLFTGADSEVPIASSSIQTLVDTLESSAVEYENIVGEI